MSVQSRRYTQDVERGETHTDADDEFSLDLVPVTGVASTLPDVSFFGCHAEYEAMRRKYQEEMKKRQDRSDKLMESMEATCKMEEATSAKASETAVMEREEAEIRLERARPTRDREDSAEVERLMNDVIRLSGTPGGLGTDSEIRVRET